MEMKIDQTDSPEKGPPKLQETKRKTSAAWKHIKKDLVTEHKAHAMVRQMSREETLRHEVSEKLGSNFYIDDGVSKWAVIHPIGENGIRQSPIDIQTGRVKPSDSLKPLHLNYSSECCLSVVNSGNSWTVEVNDKEATLRGGATKNEYRLIQFHAHWGTTAGAKGSEHTVNGRLYDAELHLVHWNTKYNTFSNAVQEPDGLAVVGIFMEIDEFDQDHPELEKVLSTFGNIQYKTMRAKYEDLKIDPLKLLPDDLTYWHYQGSLTTPPLAESVLWHVLRHPIKISRRQLAIMASLRTGTCKADDHTCIINNFRPPVPLGTRNVFCYTGDPNICSAEGNFLQVPGSVSPGMVSNSNSYNGLTMHGTQQQNEMNTLLASQIMEMKNLILELKSEVNTLKSSINNK